jgi:hypothetical protein
MRGLAPLIRLTRLLRVTTFHLPSSHVTARVTSSSSRSNTCSQPCRTMEQRSDLVSIGAHHLCHGRPRYHTTVSPPQLRQCYVIHKIGSPTKMSHTRNEISTQNQQKRRRKTRLIWKDPTLSSCTPLFAAASQAPVRYKKCGLVAHRER